MPRRYPIQRYVAIPPSGSNWRGFFRGQLSQNAGQALIDGQLRRGRLEETEGSREASIFDQTAGVIDAVRRGLTAVIIEGLVSQRAKCF